MASLDETKKVLTELVDDYTSINLLQGQSTTTREADVKNLAKALQAVREQVNLLSAALLSKLVIGLSSIAQGSPPPRKSMHDSKT